MWKTIREIWAWPGIKNNINQLAQNCETCSEWARSKVIQAPIEVPEEVTLSGPMDHVGIDMCHWLGQDFLVMVDLFSFYIG